jgi:hypothetical protein
MNHDNPSFDRVERALDIYRNIAACNAHITRGDDSYAHAAALMLPCYRVAFEKLARQLTGAEEEALMSRLRAMARPAPLAPNPPAARLANGL